MRDGDEPMTEARTLTPLDRLAEHGQSVWLDQISRELVGSGDLERLIRERNVTGLTSNPTIFAKAIADGRGYDEQLRELIRSGLTDADALYIEVTATDIQRAADVMRPVFDRTDGRDGFVSMEVRRASGMTPPPRWRSLAPSGSAWTGRTSW